MPYKFNPFTGSLDIEGPILTGSGTVSSAADGTAAIPGINFADDLNTGIYRPGNDQLAISTGGNGRLFIDSSGRLLVGTSSAVAPDGTNYPAFQVNRPQSSGLNASALIREVEGSTSWPKLYINKNRQNNPMQADNKLGSIDFYGDTGSSDKLGARVEATAEATWTTSSHPTRFVFSVTANGASSPTERMRIDSSGRVGIGTSLPEELLHLSKTSAGSLVDVLKVDNGSGATNTEVGMVFECGADRTARISSANVGSDLGALKFWTAGSVDTLTERARIGSSGIVNINNTPVYADNAAAKTGGLVDGDIYRKSDGTLMIVYT